MIDRQNGDLVFECDESKRPTMNCRSPKLQRYQELVLQALRPGCRLVPEGSRQVYRTLDRRYHNGSSRNPR
jgi:hypothetical protein